MRVHKMRAWATLALSAALCAGAVMSAQADTPDDADLQVCLESQGHVDAATARDAVRACNAAARRIDEPVEPDLAADVRVSRAVALRRLGMFAASLDDLDRALALAPDKADALRMRAWTFRETGDYELAERDLTRSLELEEFWQGYLSRCVVRLDLESPVEALPDCREALSRQESEDSFYFTALALYQIGQIQDAADTIERSFGRDIVSDRLFEVLAAAQASLGRIDAAHETRERGLERFPDSAPLKQLQLPR